METTTGAVNKALYFILGSGVILFVAIVIAMVLLVLRYRRSRNPVATELHGAPWLEVLWVVLPTILAVVMFFYGLTGYNVLRHPPADALDITVHSRQFSWSFEYPGGRREPDLVLPEGRSARLTLTSDDVIHGFYVPDYRVQVDAVPGMKTTAWLKTAGVGESDILCTVYCGTAHSDMMAKLYVVSASDYEDWLEGKPVKLGAAEAHPMVMTEGAEGFAVADKLGCLSCHSTDGTESVGPSLKGLLGTKVTVVTKAGEKTLTIDEAYLRRAIEEPGEDVVKGFDDMMPKDPVTPEDLEAMIEWLKSGAPGGM